MSEAQKLAVWWRPPAFFAILALIFGLLYVAGSRVYVTRRLEGDRRTLLDAASARVLLIGSSHAKDFSLKAAGLDGVTIARGGMDLFELSYITRAVLRKAERLDTVVIALSYFSFSFDNAAYVEHGVQTRIGRRVQTYSSFPRLAFLPGDASQFLKGMLWPLVTKDHYQRMFRDVGEALTSEDDDEDANEIEPEHPAPAKAAGGARRPVTPYRRAGLVRHALRRCKEHSQWARVMHRNHPKLADDARAYALDLVRELEAKKIRVILFTGPFLKPYSDCFEAYMQRAMRGSARWLERSTHARYFDYSLDAEFVGRDDYFSDSDHLNPAGRTELTLRLLEEIGRLGVAARPRPRPRPVASSDPGATKPPLSGGTRPQAPR